MSAILDRVKHLPSTGIGIVAGALVMYMFSSLGCKLPSDWMTWGAGFVAALPGILSKG